jgi:putative transcriptional regulator
VAKSAVTNKLRAYRFNHGEMTQQQLADQVGLTRQTIVAIEQGHYAPSLEAAFKIVRVFNANLEEVFQYQSR